VRTAHDAGIDPEQELRREIAGLLEHADPSG
jgi:hypothetical protein